MKIKLAATGILIIAVSASVQLFSATEAQQEPQGPPPAPVRVSDAMRTEMSSVIWIPGTIVSRNDARIASEVSGRINWMAEVGDYVREGEPLVRSTSAEPFLGRGWRFRGMVSALAGSQSRVSPPARGSRPRRPSTLPSGPFRPSAGGALLP